MWREATACRAACLLALCILESQGRFQSLRADLLEPKCLLAAPGLSAAIHRFLGKLDRSAPHATAPAYLASLEATKHKSAVSSASRSLISLVDSLGDLRLMPSSRGEAAQGATNTTFFYESVGQESGRVGTGMLGQGCGDRSVSEVAITVAQGPPFLWTNLTGTSMSFEVGPPCAGTYLISGKMWPTKATAEGISGKLRAMTGTWSTGPSGLDGNLTVAFRELLDVEWTLKPEPCPRKSAKFCRCVRALLAGGVLLAGGTTENSPLPSGKGVVTAVPELTQDLLAGKDAPEKEGP